MENFVIARKVSNDAARVLEANGSSYNLINSEPPVTLVKLVDALYHGQVDGEHGPVFYELNRETGQGVALWLYDDPLARTLHAWDKDKERLKEWAKDDSAWLFEQGGEQHN